MLWPLYLIGCAYLWYRAGELDGSVPGGVLATASVVAYLGGPPLVQAVLGPGLDRAVLGVVLGQVAIGVGWLIFKVVREDD